jgi:inward rectifier potassium channel
MIQPKRNGQYLSEDELRDLGFGTRVAQQSRLRLLNRDGTFNVGRSGLSFLQSMELYNSLLTMSWSRFYLATILGFCGVNAFFALCYLVMGTDSLSGIATTNPFAWFIQAFFFSVQTFTTVGYGHIWPGDIAGNVVSIINAFVGLLGFAVATGLMFARFSRPTARIAYSEHAVIAPYRDITAFMFRIANMRRSQLIEVDVKVLLITIENTSGTRRRHFHQLYLERDHVGFFPLTWTIVHPVDENSPLFGTTEKEMRDQEMEFLVLLTAIDDAFSQTVHSRTSYRYDEVLCGVRFVDIFVGADDSDGILRVNLRRLNDVERIGD